MHHSVSTYSPLGRNCKDNASYVWSVFAGVHSAMGSRHHLVNADHPPSGVVYNFGGVCLSLAYSCRLCVSVRLSKVLKYEIHICTSVYINGIRAKFVWRSPGQGQVTAAKKVTNACSCIDQLLSRVSSVLARWRRGRSGLRLEGMLVTYLVCWFIPVLSSSHFCYYKSCQLSVKGQWQGQGFNI